MPRADFTHKMVNGERVDLTEAEIDAFVAMEDAATAAAPALAAQQEIDRLESLETPHRLAESVLTAEGKAWLQANRDLIAVEREKL